MRANIAGCFIWLVLWKKYNHIAPLNVTFTLNKVLIGIACSPSMHNFHSPVVLLFNSLMERSFCVYVNKYTKFKIDPTWSFSAYISSDNSEEIKYCFAFPILIFIIRIQKIIHNINRHIFMVFRNFCHWNIS